MRVKCINQIPDGKQREPENCTSQVEIVTRAPFEPPVHPRKQLKRFRDVRKGDDHKARRAEELEKSRDGLSSRTMKSAPQSIMEVGTIAISALIKARDSMVDSPAILDGRSRARGKPL